MEHIYYCAENSSRKYLTLMALMLLLNYILTIALVAGAVLWLGTRFKISSGVTAAVAAAAITFYAVLCGLTPPVARSVLMGLVGLAAVGLGREKDAPAALTVAVLGMVIYQPALIYDVSFQLSCGATAGLVFLYSKTLPLLHFLPRWAAGVLAATLTAQLGVLPFIAWYFNNFSLSSFVANLFIVPIVEALVMLGLLGAVAGVVFQPAGNIIMVLCSLLIGLVVQLTAWLAAVPGSKLYLPPIGVGGGIIYYLLLLWLYGYFPVRLLPLPAEVVRRWPHQVAGALVIITIAGMLYVWYPRPVYVHFIDVGQGDAILITTPHGRAIMIDTGGLPGDASAFDIGEQVVLPYLRHYGVLSVDYLLLTHGHQDHAGGAAAIAAALPVRNIMLAREEKHTPAIEALLHAKYGKEIIPAYAGQSIMIDGLAINMVYDGDSAGRRAGNETSCVIKACFGKHSFLFTGDLEDKGEAVILARGQLLTSTVLKVGHHGAKTSSTPQFLQAVAPEYAVISVGYGNRFGHPHQEILKRLADMNIKVFRTDQQGAVVFETDGDHLAVDTFIK